MYSKSTPNSASGSSFVTPISHGFSMGRRAKYYTLVERAAAKKAQTATARYLFSSIIIVVC
jgi:hypothetical protein